MQRAAVPISLFLWKLWVTWALLPGKIFLVLTAQDIDSALEHALREGNIAPRTGCEGGRGRRGNGRRGNPMRIRCRLDEVRGALGLVAARLRWVSAVACWAVPGELLFGRAACCAVASRARARARRTSARVRAAPPA